MLVGPEKNCEKQFKDRSDGLGQYNLPTDVALLYLMTHS